MAEWTPEARAYLEGYLAQVGALARHKGDDAGEIVEDLRGHVTQETEEAAGAIVTLDNLRRTLAAVGTPEQVIDAGVPAKAASMPRRQPAPREAPVPPPIVIQQGPPARSTSGCWIVGIILLALCVIAIPFVAILAAIAIPNLLRARLSANESAAIGSLRTLTTAQAQYHAANNQFATDIGSLYDPADPAKQYIDKTLSTGTKQGYTFTVNSADPSVSWGARASPLVAGKSGVRTFTVDESGIMRDRDTGYTI